VKKSECIAKYGEAAWQKQLAQSRAWQKAHQEQENARSKKWKETHPEEVKAYHKEYREEHPEQVKANHQEQNRNGGKHYDQKLEYMHTGLQGARNKVRNKHNKQYKPYKDIIAPESQLHHEWIPVTSEYRGVALVEAKPHQYGIIDVIEILDGKITLLTEEEVKKKGGKDMNNEKKVEGRVTSWGVRLAVPAGIIKGIGLVLEDEVEWALEERDGKMVAVLSKKKEARE
jgi:hypothetical protein